MINIYINRVCVCFPQTLLGLFESVIRLTHAFEQVFGSVWWWFKKPIISIGIETHHYAVSGFFDIWGFKSIKLSLTLSFVNLAHLLVISPFLSAIVHLIHNKWMNEWNWNRSMRFSFYCSVPLRCMRNLMLLFCSKSCLFTIYMHTQTHTHYTQTYIKMNSVFFWN